MKTYLSKQAEIERKWYLIDAKGKTLGKLAVEAASLLRGKRKPNFAPHMDTGDAVLIINATEVRLSGKKWDQKQYRSHSGYMGGLKSFSALEMKERNPKKIIESAVMGMLPKNKLRDAFLKRLRVFPGPQHTLEAQKPEAYTFS